MPSFSGKLDDKNQFIIFVKVTKSPTPEAYKDGTVQELIIKAPAKRALVDTGAASTCISQEYADELELVAFAKTKMITAGEPCDANRYRVDLAIPVSKTMFEEIQQDDGKIVSKPIGAREEYYWAHPLQNVLSIPAIGRDRGFDVILGMDILSQMHITMCGNQIIMSF